MTFLTLTPAMGTHVGMRRRQNEDAVGYEYPTDETTLSNYGALFIVADGVGGLTAGDRASALAVEQLTRRYYEMPLSLSVHDRLIEAVQRVNMDIYTKLNKQAATTLTAVVFHADKLIAVSVGDSLLFHIIADHIEQMNQADVTNEGDKQEALTKALGYRSNLEVEPIIRTVNPGDTFLLCTDGLTRYVSPENIARLTQLRDPRDGVRRLIQAANSGGGGDNISALLVQVGAAVPFAEINAHIAKLTVPVSIDHNLMMTPDVPTKPNTQIPMSRPEPVLPPTQPVPMPRSQPQPRPEPVVPVQAAATDNTTRGLLIAGAVIIGLGIIVAIVALFGLGQGTTAQPTSAPTDASTTPIEQSTNALQIDDTIRLTDSVVTVLRIGDPVGAFVASPDTPYRIDDQIQDDEGLLWYRLLDEQTGQLGWVSATDLPEYHIQNDS